MRSLIALVFAALPSVAVALSCIPPNAGRVINSAVEDGRAIPVIVVGRLVPPKPVPKRRGYEAFTAQYRLVGSEFRKDGAHAFDESVMLRSTCMLNQWCGPVFASPVEAVFFLKRKADRLLLEVGPCQATVFTENKDRHLRALRRCLQNGRCGPGDLRLLDYSQIR